MAKNRSLRIIVALVLFVLIFLPLLTNGVGMLVDWLWFKQEGYRLIYLTILKAQINLSGIAGIGFLMVAGLNLFIAHTLAHRQGHQVYGENIEFPPLERFGALFLWLIWGGVLFAGYLVSNWGMGYWLAYLRARQVPV